MLGARRPRRLLRRAVGQRRHQSGLQDAVNAAVIADELIWFSAALANDIAAHARRPRSSWVAEWLAGLARQIVSDLRA